MAVAESAQVKLPISIAEVNLTQGAVEAATAVLRSGKLRAGVQCAAFEREFAERVGAKYAVSCSSGTAALHIVAMALLKPGDEVLIPSFTFIASATCVIPAGARPVLVDVDPATYTIDVEDAERRITPQTRAIIPVHLFGNAVDVAGIANLAQRHHLKIIWDAAQSFGTQYNSADVGGLDDAVCFSFYPTKNLTTGEGGMVTTNDRELYEWMSLFKSHGQARKYYHTVVGLNYRLTDTAAAIGREQLKVVRDQLAQRRANAARLRALLEGIVGITLPVETASSSHSYNLFTVRIDPAALGMTRDDFALRLKDRGVETAVHYPRPLHHQPALEQFGPHSALEESERAAREVLSLPAHPFLGEPELTYVAQAVRAIVAERTKA
ncbi:MAG: DegT/DnrJ/EryC1/StrS family aminotransferase [Chloroflexi bacterium]|nr:DegT/DnrJ/EryC1/StrS family aminotransferase [Chloroflexota bacterium]